MKNNNGRAAATRATLDKLESAIHAAKSELECGYGITTKDLGQLYVAYSHEDGGLYISSIHGDVEIDDGWSVTFDELSTELADNIDDPEDAVQLVAGLRRAADAIERAHSLPNASVEARQ